MLTRRLTLTSAITPAILVGLLLQISAACVPHEPRPTKDLFQQRVTVIGHRGAKGVAPENTMAGFRKAAAVGAPFELDTMLARTGEPVVIHDYTVDRVTQGRAKGRVDSMALAELRALDVGSFFSEQFRGEKIPTLEETLREMTPRVMVDVEVKFEGPRAKAGDAVRAIVDVIKSGGHGPRVFVTAFNPYILEEFRNQAPELLRGQLYGTFSDAKIPFWQKILLRNLMLNSKADPDLLAVEDVMVDEAYVRKYQALGYRILVWTVNEPSRIAQLARWGVDGIITDFPALASEIVVREAANAR